MRYEILSSFLFLVSFPSLCPKYVFHIEHGAETIDNIHNMPGGGKPKSSKDAD